MVYARDPADSAFPDRSLAEHTLLGARRPILIAPPTPLTAIGERIVIESGLQAGDRVIVAGLQKVRPGVPVKVAQAKPAGAGQAATPNKAE